MGRNKTAAKKSVADNQWNVITVPTAPTARDKLVLYRN